MSGDLDLLTVSEVAALLRRPKGTLRYWRSVDRGPKSFRQGSAVVYHRSDVVAWVEAQEQETARGGVA
jgi:hypothetical protein